MHDTDHKLVCRVKVGGNGVTCTPKSRHFNELTELTDTVKSKWCALQILSSRHYNVLLKVFCWSSYLSKVKSNCLALQLAWYVCLAAKKTDSDTTAVR